MSVYTLVEHHQLEKFLTNYDLGHLLAYQGITAGIENTNYFVTTSSGEFVLTLFESLDCDELPYFLELMAYLAEHDIQSRCIDAEFSAMLCGGLCTRAFAYGEPAFSTLSSEWTGSPLVENNRRAGIVLYGA